MKKTLCIILLILAITNCITIYGKDTYNNNSEKKKVLILHSYHKGLAWTDEFQRGIEEELKQKNIEIIVQYMDSYRFNHANYTEDIYNYYFHKYKNEKIDLIFAIDNFAYDFLKIYYDKLFRDIPIIFGGINNFSKDDLINDNSTGIAQTSSHHDMIDLILDFHNEIDTIIISGNINATAVAEAEAIVKKGELEHPEIKFIPILTNTLEEQLSELNKYTENTAIIVAGTSKDIRGNFYDHSTFSSKLISETGFPAYAMAKCYIIDNGVIGGIAVDSYKHGRIVADYAKALFEGADISELPIIEEPIADYIFDYNRLNEFNIDKDKLPKGSIILNGPSEKLFIDKKYAIGAAISLIIMLLLIVGFLFNNIRRKRTEEILVEKNAHIEFLAYHDPLTKLIKREKLIELFSNRIKSNNHEGIGVYNLEISNLKTINDTYGHDIGNQVLKEVAILIEETLEKGNQYIGIHHTEFIILDFLAYNTDDTLKSTENILNKVLMPINVGNIEIDLEMNIGIAFYPDNGENGAELFKNANIALIEAIKNGRNSICLYQDIFFENIVKRIELEKQLSKGIQKQEFELLYQPKVDAQSCEVLGVEALIRWNHPYRGLVYPGQFIEVAEETGLINIIGEWVIFEACKQIKEWEEEGLKLNISVNISVKQLIGLDLLQIVKEAINSNKIDPSLLELEITETAMMQDIKHNAYLILELRKLGIGIALDDFGTGYSSMNYIKELAITKVKVDKSFIDNIHEREQREIIKSIITLGQALNFIINIEGVERVEQFKILQEYYANEIQGYLFSKAILKQDVPVFIKEFKSKFKHLY